MLCSGEELDIITSGKEWAEMMGERLLIPAAATTTITSNINNTTTACSGSGSGATNPNNNKNSNMVARVSDKPPPATDQALRCPRCDSSNTKFCYYNNYSLSQPRHFCKACKRYWTRGGTLRNVPVGGGCRKNKRVRKPSAAAAAPRALPPPDPIASSAHLDAATIYALQTAAAPLPILTSAFELPPPPNLGGLGLELQGLPPASSAAMSLFGDYPLYGSNLSSASLVMSGVKQAKQVEDYQTLLQFDELQASEISGIIKLEAQANSMNINSININSIDWQTVPHDNLLDNFSPAAAMYWNTGGGSGIWPDGVNCGSSVSPLI